MFYDAIFCRIRSFWPLCFPETTLPLISVLTLLLLRKTSCLGESDRWCKSFAVFRLKANPSSRSLPQESNSETLARFGTGSYTWSNDKGGGGEERRQGSGLVPSAKICQDLRPVLQTHPPSRPRPFFSLRVRIEHRLPRPCLQTLYLATAGALEVMSTNRCCREICFYCSTVPSMSQYF